MLARLNSLASYFLLCTSPRWPHDSYSTGNERHRACSKTRLMSAMKQRSRRDPPDFEESDLRVLSKEEVCHLTSLSPDSLDRLHRANLGPPRVQLSERRVGYVQGPLRRWLAERSSS